MDEIEVVIKISEKDYLTFSKLSEKEKENELTYYEKKIANGIPLPKGYGKIGDLDKLIQAMKARNDDNGGEPLNAVDRGYDLAFQHMVEEAKECVIIEADKEGE